jgi:hypothetical protein
MKPLKSYIPETKWHAWKTLTRKERALQIAAYFVDVLKVRETSHNRGEILDAMKREVGFDAADRPAWCGIFVASCLYLAGYKSNELPSAPAGVRFWESWASGRGLLSKKGRRGDLCLWLNKDKTGHIGFCVWNVLGVTMSLEGNTSSGEKGSQRDGDGAFRRTRVGAWKAFIRLPE